MKSLKSGAPGHGAGIAQATPASALLQAQEELRFETNGQGLYEITREVDAWLGRQGLSGGLLTLFLKHTSASLVIQENIDHEVLLDINTFFRRLVPEDGKSYRHDEEGPDDMPAHIRAALTQSHLAIPVEGRRMALGRYQGVFLYEHRAAPKSRLLALHWQAMAEAAAQSASGRSNGPAA